MKSNKDEGQDADEERDDNNERDRNEDRGGVRVRSSVTGGVTEK